MNTTNTSDGLMNGNMSSGLSYGAISLTVCILIFTITAVTLACYFCDRAQSSPPHQPQELHRPPPQPPVADNEVRLDEATLLSYPTLLYSHTKINNRDTTSCCSICLADFKDTDMLRLLPDCRHIFHVKCVDTWLRLHPTCPVCRMSPLPTPLSTPLAEVVPLATQPLREILRAQNEPM